MWPGEEESLYRSETINQGSGGDIGILRTEREKERERDRLREGEREGEGERWREGERDIEIKRERAR